MRFLCEATWQLMSRCSIEKLDRLLSPDLILPSLSTSGTRSRLEIVQMGRVLSQQGTVSAWAVDLGDVSLNGLRTTEPSDPNDLRIGDVRSTPS